MTPSHHEGRDAAKRVQDATMAGDLPDAADSLCMLTYHMSLELRRIAERERMAVALKIARTLLSNTRESLD